LIQFRIAAICFRRFLVTASMMRDVSFRKIRPFWRGAILYLGTMAKRAARDAGFLRAMMGTGIANSRGAGIVVRAYQKKTSFWSSIRRVQLTISSSDCAMIEDSAKAERFNGAS
jgi:hypothetical protein